MLDLQSTLKQLMKRREEILKQKNVPIEYNQRNIVSLKAVTSWNAAEMTVQKKYNRILHSGYSDLSANEIIELALSTKEEWLTDFVCPKVEHACKLNIAADLISQFKVSSEELNGKVQQIYNDITSKNKTFLGQIAAKINSEINSDATKARILANARESMNNQYPAVEDGALLQSFIVVEEQKHKKKLTNTILKQQLSMFYKDIAIQHGLTHKKKYPKGQNVDYSILGAAGSGKSTISQKLLKGDKTDYVVLATDDYRSVYLDETTEREETVQVFTRTQDTAFSIKELVQERLSESSESRPNVILDCVSLEGWHRKLLENNKHTISIVACLNDVTVVPLRAYYRAIDENSSPADKGRHVNTSALLKGHADSSARLLTSIPKDIQTHLYDTNVPKGSVSPIMATIDTENGKHQVKVFELEKLSTFLVKANLNHEATKKCDLYYREDVTDYRCTFDTQYKAEQILNLSSSNKPFKLESYEVILYSKLKHPYAKIIADKDNKIHLKVLDHQTMNEILFKHDKGESRILKNILMQIHFGSLKKVREEIKRVGRKQSLDVAYNHLLPINESQIPVVISNVNSTLNQFDRMKESRGPVVDLKPLICRNRTFDNFRRIKLSK